MAADVHQKVHSKKYWQRRCRCCRCSHRSHASRRKRKKIGLTFFADPHRSLGTPSVQLAVARLSFLRCGRSGAGLFETCWVVLKKRPVHFPPPTVANRNPLDSESPFACSTVGLRCAFAQPVSKSQAITHLPHRTLSFNRHRTTIELTMLERPNSATQLFTPMAFLWSVLAFLGVPQFALAGFRAAGTRGDALPTGSFLLLLLFF